MEVAVTEETKKRMEEAAPKYDGSKCSSTRRDGWLNGYTAAHNDAQGVTSKLLHAEDALWSIVQSHGYKLTAEFALTLANEYFKKFKDTPYKELDDAQGEIEKLKAENSEMRFELEAKQRPLGEQVLELTLENQKLKESNRRFDELCDDQRKVNEKFKSQLTLERAASAELLKALENIVKAGKGGAGGAVVITSQTLRDIARQAIAAHHARQKERG